MYVITYLIFAKNTKKGLWINMSVKSVFSEFSLIYCKL